MRMKGGRGERTDLRREGDGGASGEHGYLRYPDGSDKAGPGAALSPSILVLKFKLYYINMNKVLIFKLYYININKLLDTLKTIFKRQ